MTFDCFCRGRKDPPPPDPGKYDIPSTIGSGPKFTMRCRHKQFEKDYAPQYNQLPSTLSKKGSTIGTIPKNTRRKDDVPGPNYNTTTIGTGRKSSMHVKHREERNENPGPGAYTINRDLAGPAYTCGTGKRNSFIVDNMPVPPGSYDLPSDIAKRRPMTIQSREREHFKKKAHPGPIYNVTRPPGSDSRKTCFPKAVDPPIPITPGPADYQHLSELGGSRIGTKMRPRTSMKKPERNKMPYYDIGTTVNPKSLTIGSRPVTSYETMSPGPGYDLGTLMVPKSRTIGERHEIHDPMLDNPAPGSYWMAEQPKKPPPIIGFPGPDDRCIINEKEEKRKPGPGYYETMAKDAMIATSRRGVHIQSRKLEYPPPDTSAPYHSCTSTLGGPKYTIGLRDV
ncbi:hypothetical protein TRFO_23104 [Tritrichomonas foetus]|uniref:Outer dense fiber protein 3 n=1 Tax=Tritrichomonas foetus TaxID=1144522 RepID=A0A1J4KB25_9EUKA|nr:hypothetical protein TRFO_23104 [Tritrichomonas foetus]|eukprot:OHT08419.1 hypothetical protein TRFO_23104 [Tritrichomonas foetus]